MALSRHIATACIILFFSSAAQADILTSDSGGDMFVAGSSVVSTLDATRDTFVAGRTTLARGAVKGDLHVAGFDTSVSADVGEDLYAAGATVVVQGTVAKDLSAAGYSVRTESTAQTQGNARLLGNSVVIEGPIAGAALIIAREVVLNAPISGDARILAKTLSFGPDAVVTGTLTYSTKKQVAVPEHVAPSDRVVFEKLSEINALSELADLRRFKEMPILPAFMSVLFGFVISVLFFVLLAALALGFIPGRLERMRIRITEAPGLTLLSGVIGLSILFGMVPITGMTIVGLPFVPITLLAIVVAWTFGYALGAYTVAMRLWHAFGGDPEPGNISRLLCFAGVIIAIALLNFIPFVGWVANYTLVLLGTGAMVRAVLLHIIGNPGPALDTDMNPIDS